MWREGWVYLRQEGEAAVGGGGALMFPLTCSHRVIT